MPITYVYPSGPNEHASGSLGIHGTVGSLTPFGGGSLDESTASGVTIFNPRDTGSALDTAVAATISFDLNGVDRIRLEALLGPFTPGAAGSLVNPTWGASCFTRDYDPQLWWTGDLAIIELSTSGTWVFSNWVERDSSLWNDFIADHVVAIGAAVYNGTLDVYSVRLALESTPPPLPPAPPVPVLEAVTLTTATVSWEPVPDALTYDLRVDGGPVVASVTSPYTAIGLVPASSGVIEVRSVNDVGESAWAAVAYVLPEIVGSAREVRRLFTR